MAQNPKIDVSIFIGLNGIQSGLVNRCQRFPSASYNNQSIIIREMKLNPAPSFYGKKKAEILGLTSSRFKEKYMSEHAEKEMNTIKRKDRSDIDLSDWKTHSFYKTDATKQLFKCPQDVATEDAESLSLSDFIEKYQKPCLPVLIRGCAKKWKIEKYWNYEYFYRNFKDFKFKVGEDDDGYKLRIEFKYYLEYLIYNKDDSPLYLFESSLENNKELTPILDHFTVPIYFQDDLLKYAGEKDRPPYRWLLMGPERSGTTVHTDPLDTSAWNTSLQGHKRWVLFPERIPKFIAKGKGFRGPQYEDEAINYFTQILPKIIESEGREQLGIIEFIQGPGETVFVPGGWWHAVMNLDDTIAVTQNVMTHINFEKVWRSIRCERRKFAQRFLSKLKEHEPELYEKAIKLNAEERFKMGQKYEQQSVSMSFTPTESSSSSSSEDFSNQSNSSKRSRSMKSKEASRSREKASKRAQTTEKYRKKTH